MATVWCVWENLAMMHSSDIAHELYVRDIAQNIRISTLEEYAHWMRIATPGLCVYGNTPEVYLIAHAYSLNVALYQVDHHNPQQYFLTEQVVVDHPNNPDNIIYLLLQGNHYQRIITLGGHYSNHAHSSLKEKTSEEQGQEPPLDPPLDDTQKDQEPPSNPTQAIPLQVP